MLGRGLLVALQIALLLAAVAVQPALGYVTVDAAGRTGLWSVADSATGAALRCTYDTSDLTTLTISPPQMFAMALRRRQVGWEYEVWRAKWWQSIPDSNQWYRAYSSGIVKAGATRSIAAVLAPRQWTIPPAFRTAYDSVKVRLVLHWYASDKITELGHTTIELQYYGVENLGQPFDPATSTYGPGSCAGSFSVPQSPANLGTREPIPADSFGCLTGDRTGRANRQTR